MQRLLYEVMVRFPTLSEVLPKVDDLKKLSALYIAAFRILYDGLKPVEAFARLNKFLGKEDLKFLQSLRLPKPENVAEALAIKHSFPIWFVRELLEVLNPKDVNELLSSLNQRLPNWIVVNPMTNEETVIKMLEEEGVQVAKDEEIPLVYKVTAQRKRLEKTRVYQRGLILLMSKSSAAVVFSMNPTYDDFVFDACAAPGMKTILSALLMENRGKILAVDISETRIRVLRDLAKHYGIRNVKIVVSDSRQFAPEGFTKALVDAPCSSSGAISRHPDVKLRLTESDVKYYCSLQRSILWNVLSKASPGSKITYSTCSLFPEENEFLIEETLAQFDASLQIPEYGDLDYFKKFGRRFFPHKHQTVGAFYTHIIV